MVFKERRFKKKYLPLSFRKGLLGLGIELEEASKRGRWASAWRVALAGESDKQMTQLGGWKEDACPSSAVILHPCVQ